MDPAPDWDAHQSSIQDLYWNEGKELPEVMRIMEEKYQFVATYVPGSECAVPGSSTDSVL